MTDNLVTAKLTLRWPPRFSRDAGKDLTAFLARDDGDRRAFTTAFVGEDDPGSIEIGVRIDSQDEDDDDVVWITITEGEIRMMLATIESMQRLYGKDGSDVPER